MSIPAAILGFLMNEPMSGYDLKARFERSVSNFYEASFGAIYPALRKMEREGLVTSSVVQQEGKPNKNVYHITDQGKASFYEYLSSPLQPDLMRSDFLIRIFFARFASNTQIRDWVCEELRRKETSIQELVQTRDQYPAMDAFNRKILEYGIRQTNMQVEWLREELASLETEVHGYDKN